METATSTIKIATVDRSADVLADFTLKTGIIGTNPSDLVASTGTLEFYLNNSASNAAAQAGFYSPGHANAWGVFELGATVQWITNYSATDRYQFFGRIVSIEPMADAKGERRTKVIAADYMDEMASRYIDPMALQTNKRSDELFTTLIATMENAPSSTSYDTGPDVATTAFYDLQGEKQTVYNIAQRIAQMSFCRIYVKGNATNGETLVLENRSATALKSSSLTLNNTMTGLEVIRERQGIINKAVVKVTNPNEATSEEVIYSIPRYREIAPGATKTFTALFRDPDGGNRLCANSVNTSPVSGTDYSASIVKNSETNDLNASLGIVINNVAADRATVALTNNSGLLMYVNRFQIKGLPLRLRDAAETTAEDASSITAYGERKYNYNAPYQDNPNTTQTIADYIVANFKDPRNVAKTVTFTGNVNSTLMTAAVNRDIGDRITLTETQTGINEDRVIFARTVHVRGNGIWNVEYKTSFVQTGPFWLLGETGKSELGTTTYLGF